MYVFLCRLESQVLLLTFKEARFFGTEVVLKSQEPFFDFSQQVKVDVFHCVCVCVLLSRFILYMFSDSFSGSRNELVFKDRCSPQFFHLGIKVAFPSSISITCFSTIMSGTIINYFSIPLSFLPHSILLAFFFIVYTFYQLLYLLFFFFSLASRPPCSFFLSTQQISIM